MLSPGNRLAGYRIEAEIGRGGMGVVYRAVQLQLDRSVALKVLTAEHAEDERFRERFIRESRLLASLEHPNIIPIYEAGEAEGRFFIAMRYVDGADLRTLLTRERRLSPSRTVEILAAVAKALDAAHARGLVHRDVKPENILVSSSGQVYLSDFGLTRRADSQSGLTVSGMFVGTPGYATPEQIEGRPVDARTDVYALGCVIFACLTGDQPYRRDDPLAVLLAHLNEPPPVLSSRLPGLPSSVDAVLARALAKRPQDRFSTCGSLMAALEVALAENVQGPKLATLPTASSAQAGTSPLSSDPGFRSPSSPTPKWTPDRAKVSRVWFAIAGIVIAAVFVVGGGGLLGVFDDTNPSPSELPTTVSEPTSSNRPTTGSPTPAAVARRLLAVVPEAHASTCVRVEADDIWEVTGVEWALDCYPIQGSAIPGAGEEVPGVLRYVLFDSPIRGSGWVNGQDGTAAGASTPIPFASGSRVCEDSPGAAASGLYDITGRKVDAGVLKCFVAANGANLLWTVDDRRVVMWAVDHPASTTYDASAFFTWWKTWTNWLAEDQLPT